MYALVRLCVYDAYNIIVMTRCVPFSVFGWFQDSFVGIEQELAHTVEVGYLKGAEVAGINISVNVVSHSMDPGMYK